MSFPTKSPLQSNPLRSLQLPGPGQYPGRVRGCLAEGRNGPALRRSADARVSRRSVTSSDTDPEIWVMDPKDLIKRVQARDSQLSPEQIEAAASALSTEIGSTYVAV